MLVIKCPKCGEIESVYQEVKDGEMTLYCGNDMFTGKLTDFILLEVADRKELFTIIALGRKGKS